ncbi:DUF5004 domain-containing protein [Flavobacteriaceae bacterium GSB9]|nr:DUF5004 domain-containing protein [Flavobacteriaceae bacterium GSB9]
MKKTILLVKSLIAMGILFVSCDTGTDDIQCPEAITGALSDTENTFAGTWTLQSIVSEEELDLTDDNTDNPSTDIYSQFSDCENNLVYIFGTDRSYNYSLGKTATDCDNQQEASGTWQLGETNNLVLVANCSRQLISLEINEENTEFSFDGTYNFTDINGVTITTNTTFTFGKSL